VRSNKEGGSTSTRLLLNLKFELAYSLANHRHLHRAFLLAYLLVLTLTLTSCCDGDFSHSSNLAATGSITITATTLQINGHQVPPTHEAQAPPTTIKLAIRKKACSIGHFS
jgi:hypothetical protein